MPTTTEIARLAAAINLLRPDWPTASITTLVTTKHAARPLRDLAVALAWVAADPDSRTPARINDPGPWWVAPGEPSRAAPADNRACPTCGHFHRPDEGHYRRDQNATTRGAALARVFMTAEEEPPW